MNNQTSVEITAATVEDAIQKGLDQLGVGPGQVIVEVIEEPSRGLFGLGSKQARVRLQLLAPPPPPPAPKPAPPPPPDPPKPQTIPPQAPPVEEPMESSTPIPSAPPEPDEAVKAVDEEAPERDPAPAKARSGSSSRGTRSNTAKRKDDQRSKSSSDTRGKERGKESTPKPKAKHGESTPIYYGDDDDFFDEDGSYGSDAEEFFQAAVEKKPPHPKQDDHGKQENDKPPKVSKERKQSDQRVRRQDDRGKGKSASRHVETPAIAFPENADESQIAKQVLDEMLDLMGVEVRVTAYRAEPSDRDGAQGPPWVLNIHSDHQEDLDKLIGRRGETLAALQYITRLIVSKQTESRSTLIVDVDDYRVNRSSKLERLAERMADQAVETNRTVTMEPMPPYERRIIHMVLRNRDDVETESRGQGDGRRVTIIPRPESSHEDE